MPKRKTRLTSFDIAVLVEEWRATLIGSRIEKAYQPTRDEFWLKLSTSTGKFFLVTKLGKWCYLCSQAPKFETPTPFAMLIRKYLVGGWLTEISQHEFDRIIMFTIERAGTWKLVIELFSTGNILLVKDGTIVHPLRTQRWQHRVLSSGERYNFPPAQCDPRTLKFENFCSILNLSAQKNEIVRALAVEINLGGLYAEEVCLRAAVNKQKQLMELKTDELQRLYEAIHELFAELSTNKKCMQIFKNAQLLDAVPVALELYADYEQVEKSTFNDAIASFVSEVEKQTEVSAEKFAEARKRLERQLSQQNEAIREFETEIAYCQSAAESLYMNYTELEKLRSAIFSELASSDWDTVKRKFGNETRIKAFDDETLSVTVELDRTAVKLSVRETLNKNAQNYYEKIKKLRRKLEHARIAAEKTISELKNLRIEQASAPKPRQKRYWFEKYRWFITTDGNVVVAGKDINTNERVVKKYLKPGDIFVHADVHGAPSVVLKREDKKTEISVQSIEEACAFALIFSRLWGAGAGGGESFWVNAEQVSKTPPSGEYVPKGSFIITGRKNYLSAKLEAAVGEILLDNERKLMCGPVSALKSRCRRFVVFRPGELDKNLFALQLAKAFETDVEIIQKILPPGNVKIIESTFAL